MESPPPHRLSLLQKYSGNEFVFVDKALFYPVLTHSTLVWCQCWKDCSMTGLDYQYPENLPPIGGEDYKQGLSRDIWGIPDNREMETISIPSFLLPTASELLIPSSFLPCSSHLTLQRIGRSRIIFIKIQTPVFYKYLLEIAFFYCEVQLIQQIRNQL